MNTARGIIFSAFRFQSSARSSALIKNYQNKTHFNSFSPLGMKNALLRASSSSEARHEEAIKIVQGSQNATSHPPRGLIIGISLIRAHPRSSERGLKNDRGISSTDSRKTLISGSVVSRSFQHSGSFDKTILMIVFASLRSS